MVGFESLQKNVKFISGRILELTTHATLIETILKTAPIFETQIPKTFLFQRLRSKLRNLQMKNDWLNLFLFGAEIN